MEGNGNGQKLVLAVVFIASLIAVVAIILAAVSMSKNSGSTAGLTLNVNNDASMSAGGGSTGGTPAASGADRIWLVQIGHDNGGLEYLDESGYIVGFHSELITEVCEAGGMQCRLVWDTYSNCFTSVKGGHQIGGLGLMDEYYDACVSWLPTVTRVQIFDFSLPFAALVPVTYHILADDKDFDPAKAEGYKIAFINGYYVDEACLARSGINLPLENTVYYETPTDCFEGLKKGEVRALFGLDHWYGHWLEEGSLKSIVYPEYTCALAGAGMVTRKDNDFNSYWNVGFQKLRDSGRFKKLCDENQTKHSPRKMKDCVD